LSRRLTLAFGLLLSACLSPRQAVEPRYFSAAGPAPTVSAAASAQPTGPELRLRRVFAADYLRDRMVWRRGVEVGFHDLLRWTEPPASYLEARVSQELFERRGLRRVIRPGAPSLAVELLAFDDVLEPVHEGVVAIAVLLVDRAQVARLERTFRSSRPIEGDDPEAVARALGEALAEAVTELGAAVEAALGEGPR